MMIFGIHETAGIILRLSASIKTKNDYNGSYMQVLLKIDNKWGSKAVLISMWCTFTLLTCVVTNLDMLVSQN